MVSRRSCGKGLSPIQQEPKEKQQQIMENIKCKSMTSFKNTVRGEETTATGIFMLACVVCSSSNCKS
ncbi:hypothetical protein SUGI_0808830 [Cryptomeria japonica]|nr:hypothetical protein SUGI_0808830 [Cryptomeria japonica]